MKSIVLILVIFYLTFLNAQQREALIVDSNSKEIIPYAAVKYINSKDGTYSDEKGFFKINSAIDSIEISCIGYQSKKLKTEEIENKIYLDPNIILLKTVKLNSSSPIEMLGKNKSTNFIGLGSFVNNTINLAKRFDFKSNIVLKSVQLDILNNETEKIALLKIYDIDSNNKPLKNILEYHIYYKILPYDKTITIDLSDNQILLENKSYFIVLELFHLKAEKGESPVKIGFYKSKKSGYSLLNSSSSINNEWASIKVPNSKYEYNLNLYLKVEKTD